MREVEVGRALRLGSGHPLAWIVGPDTGRDEAGLMATAEGLKKLSEKLGVPVIFKAGRESPRLGARRQEGIREREFETLAWLRSELELPLLGEVGSEDEIEVAGQLLDVIQIPDFACQQPVVLAEAAATGRPLSLARAGFLSAEALAHTVAELSRNGNPKLMLSEGGVSFGYADSLGDMTMIPRLRELGWPVVVDVASLGRRFAPGRGATEPSACCDSLGPLLRGAIAAGAAAVSLEIAPGPSRAGAEARTSHSLEELEELMQELSELGELVRARGHA